MSAPGPKKGRRFGRAVLGVTIALGAAIAACNSIAELDIKYSPDPLQVPADGDVGDGGSRKVRDSSFEATPEPVPVPFDATPLGSCEGGVTDEEALCNHTAGLGCCIRPPSGKSECMQQFDFQKYCLAGQPAAFVACVKSNDSSECCWRTDKASGGRFAVYSKSCLEADNSPMVCTEDADCPIGKFCNTDSGIGRPCHPDIKFGICGEQNGAGPVCP